MSARYFLDTNIFVYTFEPADPAKKARAEELVTQALNRQEGLISSQVFQESSPIVLHQLTHLE